MSYSLLFATLIYTLLITGINSNALAQNNISIKKSIDSVSKKLKADTVRSCVVLFDIDVNYRNGYGCFLKISDGQITGAKILISESEKCSPLNKRIMSEHLQLFKDLFRDPDMYTNNFFAVKQHRISHDPERYFLLKVNGVVLFDQYFYFSEAIDTQNTNAKMLLLQLSRLTSE